MALEIQVVTPEPVHNTWVNFLQELHVYKWTEMQTVASDKS